MQILRLKPQLTTMKFGTAAANFLRNDFYVDDDLKSIGTVQEAVKLVNSTKLMCSKGGFNLHNFVSNSKKVLKEIPESDRADGVKDMDLDLDPLLLERTLGAKWCVKTDQGKQKRAQVSWRPIQLHGIKSNPLGDCDLTRNELYAERVKSGGQKISSIWWQNSRNQFRSFSGYKKPLSREQICRLQFSLGVLNVPEN